MLRSESSTIISVKLSDSSRSIIRNKLVGNRFDQRWLDLVPKFAALAVAVYEDLHDAKTRKLIESLPDGFLCETDHLGVRFGGECADYHRLFFNGYFSGLTLPVKWNEKRPDVRYRITYCVSQARSDRHFPTKHPLSVRFFALEREINGIKADREKLEREINGVLQSVSTTGKLIEVWPEIKHIVKEIAPVERKSLPAPVLNDLNQRLGLAASKKAA